MPAGAPLKTLLDVTERMGPVISPTRCGARGPPTGSGRRGANFRTATVPQTATFTGHSLKDVEAILDANYPGHDVQLAEAAVAEARSENKTVNGGVHAES